MKGFFLSYFDVREGVRHFSSGSGTILRLMLASGSGAILRLMPASGSEAILRLMPAVAQVVEIVS